MNCSRKSAFTLFELLATMAVISILLGAGFFSIARSKSDRALDRAADTLHSMVRLARTQAITNGVHSRLIINNDPDDSNAYLRQIGVVLEADESIEVDGTTYDESVLAIERGAFLPEGVYIVPQGNDAIMPTGLPRSIYKKKNDDTSEDTAVYSFDYPLLEVVPVGVSGTPDWICIQFAPNGRLSSATPGGGGLLPLSNQLILAKGRWNGDKLDFTGATEFLGISFKSSGSSYLSKESALFELEKEEVEEGD